MAYPHLLAAGCLAEHLPRVENGLGKAGTIIVLIAWLLVALVLLIDLSMSDLVSWLAEKYKHSHSRFADFIRKKAEQHRQKMEQGSDLADFEEPEEGNQQAIPIEPGIVPSIPTTVATDKPAPEKAWVLP